MKLLVVLLLASAFRNVSSLHVLPGSRSSRNCVSFFWSHSSCHPHVSPGKLPVNTARRIGKTRVRLLSTPTDQASPGPEIVSPKEKLKGTLVLLSVPLTWGTYGPVVRYLYELQPPVPGLVFSAFYYALAAVTTVTLATWQESTKSNSSQVCIRDETTSTLPLIGGLELGSYLFLANCLQVVGLRTVQSDRAGFLVQLTTVMVPVVEATFAGNLRSVPLRTWFACVFAFLGLFVMGLDGKEAMAGNPLSTLVVSLSSLTQGDLLIVAAAMLYTLHVVRLGTYARNTTPMKLAASKATVETFWSVLLVVGLVAIAPLSSDVGGNQPFVQFAVDTGNEIMSFAESFSTGLADRTIPQSALLSAMGAVLWTGWVTCAYTIYAQSFGQARVTPTQANLIYTFQPIFTALFAFLLLGETMGPTGFAGGGMIAASVYVVAASSLVEEGVQESRTAATTKATEEEQTINGASEGKDLHPSDPDTSWDVSLNK